MRITTPPWDSYILQILCDWVIKNRRARDSEEKLDQAIAREYENFFVGRYSPKQLHRVKRLFNLNNLNKFFATIKEARDAFGKGAEK